MVKKSYMLFSIKDRYYAVNVDYIQEIINSVKILDIPRKKDYCEGIISLRGEILPIINGRKIFNIEKPNLKDDETVIILKNKEDYFGLLVEKVIDVLKIREDEFLEANAKNNIQGIIKSNEKLYKFKNYTVIVLDINFFDKI
ncbi:chemotaxis protein CheW [Fusobacterium sp. IOR10]|uniref:chemotaxis protein CheW n=1 Tax=Fusobacterium sp. IOR10 TaxID=2665157 RepID=UPI0013D2597B|nr:chemotaxis protein CheW [Fusobacterium sp. IOR10]